MRAPIFASTFSAALLFSAAAQAMEIRQFDKMALEDQSAYVGRLVAGAQKTLRNAGHADQAAQVEKLFTTKDPGDKDSHGIIEFEMNLALARQADARRAPKDPHALRLEVEHAMIVTLKKNGITLPWSFMHVNDNFRPKHPPKK